MRDLVRVAALLAVLAVLAAGCGPDVAGIFDTLGFGGSGSGTSGEVESSASSSASASASSASGGDSDGPSSASSGDGPSSASSGDGPSSASLSSSTGPEDKEPVEVDVLLSPSPVLEVGEVLVSVWTSRPAESIDIFDGDTPLVIGAEPGLPVHVFEVTSDDAPGDGKHTIRAVAHAADGVSGQGEKDLLVDVQPGGTDVWPPYVKAGPINGFTAAALRDNGIDVAGFLETNQALEAVAVRIDGTKGQPEGEPILLGPVSATGGGRGPAIAAGDDASFVAWTRPDSGTTRWAVSRVVFGEGKGETWTGPLKSSAHAIAVAGDVLIVVGSIEVGPNTHDLGVWWVSAETGEILDDETFAMPLADDQMNKRDEVARGVAIVAGEIVVVGEREIVDEFNKIYRRTVVLRYSLNGTLIDAWTSPGEQLEEDGGMAVAPLRGGGFVVTGWGRDKLSVRQVLTRWFSAEGKAGAPRIEPTPANDAIGYAVGEDREGKIIIAGSIMWWANDVDAWIFAIPGPLGEPTWEVKRNGPGNGPDEVAGLAVDAWGYVYGVGSEFDALMPRAFAQRLYP